GLYESKKTVNYFICNNIFPLIFAVGFFYATLLRKNKIDKIDTTFSNNLGSGSIYKCDLDLSTLQNMYKLKLK
ncbi:hypothetical protein, partial [Paenibacillus alvei]|uniref:hypothetical protein n=1 Tax=Paenibacillus alvei TaxID=44250 RepID=UPI00227ECB54